ncbi:radical SAM protein, partial [Streptomyces sp. WM6386]
FHEREVRRTDVFRAVRHVLDSGTPVSFHLAGTGPQDPYLADVTAAIRREFADRVPMLVNEIRPVGRAASWATAAAPRPDGGRALPCAMAAWPVVAFDGTVLACCNQQTVDRRPAPAHLLLGHVAKDDWA